MFFFLLFLFFVFCFFHWPIRLHSSNNGTQYKTSSHQSPPRQSLDRSLPRLSLSLPLYSIHRAQSSRSGGGSKPWTGRRSKTPISSRWRWTGGKGRGGGMQERTDDVLSVDRAVRMVSTFHVGGWWRIISVRSSVYRGWATLGNIYCLGCWYSSYPGITMSGKRWTLERTKELLWTEIHCVKYPRIIVEHKFELSERKEYETFEASHRTGKIRERD